MVKDTPTVRLASPIWQQTAARLIGKNSVVVFVSRFKDPEWVGTCFYWLDFKYQVILIKSGLGVWDAIRVFVHEMQHFVIDQPGELRKVDGRWSVWASPLRKRQRGEAAVRAASEQIMKKVNDRFEELKQTNPRPAGYWDDPGPIFFNRWLAEVLDLIY